MRSFLLVLTVLFISGGLAEADGLSFGGVGGVDLGNGLRYGGVGGVSLDPQNDSDSGERSCSEEPSLWTAGLKPTDRIRITVVKFDQDTLHDDLSSSYPEVETAFCVGDSCRTMGEYKRDYLNSDLLTMHKFFCAGNGENDPASMKFTLAIAGWVSNTEVESHQLPLAQLVKTGSETLSFDHGAAVFRVDLVRK